MKGTDAAQSRTFRLLLAALALFSWLPAAKAGFYSFKTPLGAKVESQFVSAQADLVTGNGTISIALFNLFANPKSASQTISGIHFTTSNPVNIGLPTMLESYGNIIEVNKDSTFTSFGKEEPLQRWHLTNPSTTLIALGGGQPDHLIIGPSGPGGLYSNANSSIKGGQFNPFVHLSAHFLLRAPAVTPNTRITGMTFFFGTSAGSQDGVGVSEVVPAPPSLVLMLVAAGCYCARYVPRVVRAKK